MKKFFLYFSLFIFLMNNVFAENIPILVISPGKTLQSKGTVGSDVEVIDNKVIARFNQYFIGDILDNNLNGINFSLEALVQFQEFD